MIVDHITDLIGNTPMLKIPEGVHGLPNVNLYAKMEMMNPFGSVKDRLAWAMLKDDLDDLIKNDKLIVENSAGNTAKAIQAIAGMYGLKFKLMSTMAKIQEPKDILKIMGAEIEELSQASTDCFDPNDPNDPQYMIEKLVTQSNGKVYFPSQFTNEKNNQIHRETTGQEIMKDLDRVDWLVGGLGTSGSTRGVVEALKERGDDIKCLGVCASDYDYIPGIRSTEQMWETGIFLKSFYKDIVGISSSDAIDAMLELNNDCALLCGPSAGAQYHAIKEYFSNNPVETETNIIFFACDRMEWYISYIKKYRPDLFDVDAKDQDNYATFRFKYDEAENYQVHSQNLEPWVEQQAPIIVDMRSPASLKVFSVDGAINIPERMLEDMIEQTQPFPKDKKVLFLCAVGHKSLKIAAYLRNKGIEAYSLEGGIVEYQKAKKDAA
jgi:cysteine synthase B